jgi:hypothetical protein
MPLDIPHLVAPRALPDGSVSWEEEKPDIAKRIREGDGRLNWLGDDRLNLVLNMEFARQDPLERGLPRWEVWRAHEEGDPTLVVTCVAQRIDGDQLIMQLATHDSRTRDIAGDIIAARDKRAATLAKDARDENEGVADKLAWALGKDLGSPAQSGRIF